MLFLSIILLILLLIRLVYVFNGIGRKKQYGCQKKLKLMAIAGSGKLLVDFMSFFVRYCW